MRLPCFGQRKFLRDQWLDFFLLKHVKQGDQILPKQRWSQPFEPLNTIGNYALVAREKVTGSHEQAEDGEPLEAIPVTWLS